MLAELLARAQRIALDSSLTAAAAASGGAGHDLESEGAAALAHSASIDQFRSCVQRMTFTDLRLTCSLESLGLVDPGRPNIRFFEVLEHAALSISLIVLPAGTFIPLHDHPGMHAFTKVLAGRLDIEMLDADHLLPCSAVPLGTLVGVSNKRTLVLKAGDFCELTPVAGNIHEVTCSGRETAIMLDILLPPYPSDDACHYFAVTDSFAELCVIDEAHAWSDANSTKKQGTKGKRASGGGARAGRRRF